MKLVFSLTLLIVVLSSNTQVLASTTEDSLLVLLKEKRECDKALIYHQLADNASNSRDALNFLLNAESLFRDCNDSLYYSVKYSLILTYTEVGLSSKAISTAHALLLSDIDEYYIPYIYSALARCYVYQNDLKESYEFRTKAIEYARKTKHPDLDTFLSNHAAVLIKEQQYEEANRLILKTRNGEKVSAHNDIYLDALYGATCSFLNKPDSAILFLKRAEQKLSKKKYRDPEYTMMIWKFYAMHYTKYGKHNLALFYCDSLYARSLKQGHLSFMLKSLDLKLNAYEKMNNYSKALTISQKINVLADSIAKVDQKDIEQILSSNIQMLEEKNKMAQLNNQNALRIKNQKLKNSRLISVFLLIFLVLLVTTLILRSRYLSIIKRKQKLEEQNDTIQEELSRHSKELSIKTLQIAKLQTFIESVRNEIESNSDIKQSITNTKAKRLSKQLKRNSQTTEIWKEFEIHFKEVHSDFYNALTKEFPSLTAKERRLCALVKLDLSSKEISIITGQNVNTISVARVRLRKKLGITNEDISLAEFFSKY